MSRLMHEMQRMGYHYFEVDNDGHFGLKLRVSENIVNKSGRPLFWGICQGLRIYRGAGTAFWQQIQEFEGFEVGKFRRPGEMWKGKMCREDIEKQTKMSTSLLTL